MRKDSFVPRLINDWKAGRYMNNSYETLTLSDDYMFCKVMNARPDLCKILLESILGKEISELKNVDKQTIPYWKNSINTYRERKSPES